MAPFVAHGQNWEDVRLRRIFEGQAEGFFIDVGAGHPTADSFSHYLYRIGWRGVNVEPLPSFFELLETERPEDVNLRAVLGRDEGEVQVFEVPDMRGSSTTREDVAAALGEHHRLVPHTVRQLTLTEVCERYAPDSIDVLKVDVEGAESDVLAGGDWGRFRPRLVVVEANATETWEPELLGHDYLHAAFDGVNHWYVRADERSWIDRLAPPVSVLDDFIPYRVVEAAGGTATPPRPHQDGERIAVARTAPSLLVALSSANQLYSGTGRVLFEVLARLSWRMRIELAMDEGDPRNLELAREFASEHDLPLHTSPPGPPTPAPDTAPSALPTLVSGRSWDVVLAVSWANAATNTALLGALSPRTALAFLPLHQPLWTIPMDETATAVVDRAYRATLGRSDVVVCLSPWERREVLDLVSPGLAWCAVVPPGCDFDSLVPGPPDRQAAMLFVGDQREPRKRFDRVLATLAELRRRGVDCRLLVVGNESERARDSAPADVADAITALGYVDAERLRQAYREAAVLMLLSDYEAFGLPVIEALACATPVVLSRQPAPESLFAGHAGVVFVDGEDISGIADAVSRILADGAPIRSQIAAAREALRGRYDWTACAEHVGEQLLAAWARRCRRNASYAEVAQP